MTNPITVTLTGDEPTIRGAVDDHGNDILVVTGPLGTVTIPAGDIPALADAFDTVSS